VISAAIAVLIMAFLGVAMWFGFRATLGNTQKNVDNQVTHIGTDTGTGSTGATPSGTGAGGTVGGTGASVGGTGAVPIGSGAGAAPVGGGTGG
jgi:hypothetical protein